MTFDLYVWQSPRDLDDEGAEALLKGWQEMGGDPGQSPFEPSTDVGWFHRELMNDARTRCLVRRRSACDCGPDLAGGD